MSLNSNVVRMWDLDTGALPRGFKERDPKKHWKKLYDSMHDGEIWCEYLTEG